MHTLSKWVSQGHREKGRHAEPQVLRGNGRRKPGFGLEGRRSKSQSFASPGVFPQRVAGGVASKDSSDGGGLLFGSDASLGPRQQWPGAWALPRPRAFVSWPPVTLGHLGGGPGLHSIPQEGRAPASAC